MAEAAFESSQYQEAMKLLEQARLIDNKRSDIYHLVTVLRMRKDSTTRLLGILSKQSS